MVNVMKYLKTGFFLDVNSLISNLIYGFVFAGFLGAAVNTSEIIETGNFAALGGLILFGILLTMVVKGYLWEEYVSKWTKKKIM